MKEMRNELKNRFLKAVIGKEMQIKIYYLLIIIVIGVMFILVPQSTTSWIILVAVLGLFNILIELSKDATKLSHKHIPLQDITIYKIVLGNKKCVNLIGIIYLSLFIGLMINYDINIKLIETIPLTPLFICICEFILLLALFKVLEVVAKKISDYYMYDCLKEQNQKSDKET